MLKTLTKEEVAALNPNVNDVWVVKEIFYLEGYEKEIEQGRFVGFLISQEAPVLPAAIHLGRNVGTTNPDRMYQGFAAHRLLSAYIGRL